MDCTGKPQSILNRFGGHIASTDRAGLICTVVFGHFLVAVVLRVDFICTKVFAGHSHRSAPGKTMALLKLLSWNPV